MSVRKVVGQRLDDDIKPNLYEFYKTPDGEECLQKTYYYGKYCGAVGAVLSVYEMVLLSKPQTTFAALARFGHFTLPMTGMGLAFGASLCIAAKLRQKSDPVNHLIAGAVAGCVWGAKYKSIRVGHTWAVFLGLGGYYFKYFDHHNIPTFQMRTPEMRHNWVNMDFSLNIFEDPGRPDSP